MRREEVLARLDEIEGSCRRLRQLVESEGTETEHESAQDFAARRGVSVFTVRRWAKKGMPHSRPAGGAFSIPVREAIRWLDSDGRVVDLVHHARRAARGQS